MISGGSPTNTTNVINTLNYRGFGGVKSLNFGSNPRLMQISYDAKRQQMTNMFIRRTSNTGADNVIVNSSYDYYNGGANNGRIQKITDNTDAAYTTTYGYDAYYRLASASATAFTRSYSYDNWGNLTGVTSTGAGETGSYSLSYATNASGAPSTNRINNAGFSYDNAGNQTAGDGWTYAYDAANRLKSAGASGNNGYDGDGHKVKQDTGGYGNVYTLWSSVLGQPVVEATTSGIYRAYVYGPSGQQLALVDYNGTFNWVHSDHLGSGRKMTDVNGNVTYRGEFDPHGQTLLEVAPGGTYLNSKKFTGYERNWATNLDYANARMFHHNRARFMQPDPLGIAAADPTNSQSFNRYSYVGNDPVNFVDPSGLYIANPNPTPSELCALGFEQYCPRIDPSVFAFFYNSWNRSFGGGSSGGGTDFSGGGQEQKPINPSSYSVCPLWEGEGGDAGKKQQAIADTINSTYSPRTGQIAPNPQLTYRETVKSFEKAGWTSFINVNPEHWRGADFEKYIDGAWFHLTIGYSKSHPKGGPGYGPPQWITIHCEALYRPSSKEHSADWWKKNVILPMMLNFYHL